MLVQPQIMEPTVADRQVQEFGGAAVVFGMLVLGGALAGVQPWAATVVVVIVEFGHDVSRVGSVL